MRVVRVVRLRLITHGPNKLYDITDHLVDASRGVREGFVAVSSKGSTGAIVRLPRSNHAIEEFERNLWDLVPVLGWQHPGNAYAHLRSTLIGTSTVVPVIDEKLVLNGLAVFFLENQPAVRRERIIYLCAVETS